MSYKSLNSLGQTVTKQLVQNEKDEIEAGHECVRELDVVDDGLVLGLFGVDGVGGCQDAGAGVQLANDAALGDRKRLLFHDAFF